MGKSALEGLEGVTKVESGFYRLMEINTVYYNPEAITIKEMEEALIKAKTYKKTIQME